MGATYWPAPELAEQAAPIIERWHPHLLAVPILWVWRGEAARRHGRLVMGQARRLTGLQALLVAAAEVGGDEERLHNFAGDYDRFIIEIAGDIWRLLDASQQDALLDHELSHCTTDDDGGLHMAGHDVEEFRDVVARRGLWRPDLKAFALVAQQQLPLS